MKKRLITKSSENRSDFTSGQASKPYNNDNEGKHLLDNSNIFICYSTDSSENSIYRAIKTFTFTVVGAIAQIDWPVDGYCQ